MLWVSRFMGSQDSISVLHVLLLLPGENRTVFCPLTGVPLGSCLPSWDGFFSAS